MMDVVTLKKDTRFPISKYESHLKFIQPPNPLKPCMTQGITYSPLPRALLGVGCKR